MFVSVQNRGGLWPSVTSRMVVVVWVCVLLPAVSAVSEITLYRKVGDEVVLQPGTAPVTGAITSIMWKDGPNIATEWDGMDLDLYRQFKERGSLNIANGEMTITGLTRDDSGLYTPEINLIPLGPIRLIVISPVSAPTVIQSCDDEKTSCILTCDGNTTDAEPVTYKWKADDKVLTDSSKEHHIIKENSSSVNEFSCELENPVSRESSQPLHNPFITTTDSTEPAGHLKISAGLTVFISLLAAVLLLVFIHRWKAGAWFFQKESMPWEAGFWSKHERPPREAADSNGAAAHQEKEQIDEETRMT
ncbi:T-cell surface antigen CD2-like [Chelmon rostratus]|uniref:T-cell surface antigen CD2-like n=1 Tax=Chelmon rostratus TaxID=109905 RepID=UPI001BE7BDCE|nr:T-cell surface antigen CD2-like [Chelmon rostratus]